MANNRTDLDDYFDPDKGASGLGDDFAKQTRQGETLPAIPLNPKFGGRAPMTSTGFAIDMSEPANKTASIYRNAFENPEAFDKLSDDFERAYALDHPVVQSNAVEMPRIGMSRMAPKGGFLQIGSDGKGGTRVDGNQRMIGHVDQTPIVEMLCPKCGAQQAGDWSQCKGTCPISFSPHFNK